jgi:DNA-directed RNA polymerase specialized sigma24 family protein
MLVHALNGLSFAEIGRELMRVKRQSVLNGGSLVVQFRQLIQNRIQGLNREERTAFALLLMESGLSQRETHAWTGISRDTIRKAQQK